MVARASCMSLTTCANGRICAKLGVKTRTEAALFAIRHGLTGVAGEPVT